MSYLDQLEAVKAIVLDAESYSDKAELLEALVEVLDLTKEVEVIVNVEARVTITVPAHVDTDNFSIELDPYGDFDIEVTYLGAYESQSDVESIDIH